MELLQFQVRGLEIKNDLTEQLYHAITSCVPCEKIKAVQITPSIKWPQNVVIQCADAETKKTLIDNGLHLYGQPVELNEGGMGSQKITIRGAPLDLPNHVITEEMKKYGEFINITTQRFYAGKTKTAWGNGTRVCFLRNVKNALPPTLVLEYNGYQRKITVHHEGQTQYECRWCKNHLPKDTQHICMRKPVNVKSCFNCKATDHINVNCPHPRSCNICKVVGHMAKDCPSNRNQQTGGVQPGSNPRQNITLGAVPLAPPRDRSKRKRINTGGAAESSVTATIQEGDATPGPSAPANTGTRPRTYSNRVSLNESIQNQTHEDEVIIKEVVSCAVLGASNCVGLPLKGDDAVDLNIEYAVQGGLKIEESSSKLSSDISPHNLLEKKAVIINVGSTNFPLTQEESVEGLYAAYTDLVMDVGLKCPNARIFISSIPPRKGSLTAKINRDIKRLNNKLKEMAEGEGEQPKMITFVNNDAFLTDGQVTIADLYDPRNSDDIHLSPKGKSQLANYLFDHIKNDIYREKLASDWSLNV